MSRNDEQKSEDSAEFLASLRDRAYMHAILIGFAGRTKQKEWAENPLFSFVESRRPKLPRNRPA